MRVNAVTGGVWEQRQVGNRLVFIADSALWMSVSGSTVNKSLLTTGLIGRHAVEGLKLSNF